MLAVLASLVALTAPAPDTGPTWEERQLAKFRAATPHNPIPLSVRNCESGHPSEYSYPRRLHRVAADGLGGGLYQIIPSTWRANLPSKLFIRIAGGDRGPIRSSRLLQDKVAWTIRTSAGLDQWVCAR